MKSPGRSESATDVLIVGAGPTGLALAAQLCAFNTRFRIIDRSTDRTRESRALAVQARTLEILDTIGLADALVSRGRTSTRLALHLGARKAASVELGDIGATDTRFPFILFVSQAETEAVLVEHLVSSGVVIERGTELGHFNAEHDRVECVLRNSGGQEEVVRASYVVGCDGARSTVRKIAGFTFEGGTYPQEFVLGDIEAEGPLEEGAINSFAGTGGVAMFFPLGKPRSWRVIAMRTEDQRATSALTPGPSDDRLTLEELQSFVSRPTDGVITVRDPAWLSRFRLHFRQISHYRNGRAFLAGDAAHIHSPVGAQGMNTGIQDAWNLGWKLAMVDRGLANPILLDSYETERWPVGRFLLRYTDRIFGLFTRAMSAGRVATWLRNVVVSRIIPRLLGSRYFRRTAFRFLSELGINYRTSPAVVEESPRLSARLRAGDRLPNGRLTLDGKTVWLHDELLGAHLSLLLCGSPEIWDSSELANLQRQCGAWLRIRHLSNRPLPGVLCDRNGEVRGALSKSPGLALLVRPDGYVALRSVTPDLASVKRYLSRWYPVPQ